MLIEYFRQDYIYLDAFPDPPEAPTKLWIVEKRTSFLPQQEGVHQVSAAFSFHVKALKQGAMKLRKIGRLLGKIDQHQEALSFKQESVQVLRRLPGDNRFEEARSRHSIGLTQDELKKHELALIAKQHSLRLLLETSENHSTQPHSDTTISTLSKLNFEPFPPLHRHKIAVILSSIGVTLGKQGQYKNALAYQEIAWDLWKKIRIYEQGLHPLPRRESFPDTIVHLIRVNLNNLITTSYQLSKITFSFLPTL